MRHLTDEQIERQIQALNEERLQVLSEARAYREELDRRVALERIAQRYAEAAEGERDAVLEGLDVEDRQDVIARSEKWASHSLDIDMSVPAPMAEPPRRRKRWGR